MPALKIGPWPVGIDNVSKDHALREDALRDAVNVDIDKDGTIDTRPGFKNQTADHLNSPFYAGDRLLALRDSHIVEVDGATVTNIFDTGFEGNVGWDHHDGITYCATGNGIVVMDPDPAWLGVPEISGPILTVSSNGGLYAGRYGAAVAVVEDGEEGALSAARFIDLEDGEGIDVAMPPGHQQYRVYRTEANGEAFYRAANTASDTLTLGVGSLGQTAPTRFLRRTPGGRLVRFWRGRLLIARGRTLYWTEAMRTGVYDPRHNFVQFRSAVVMVEGVDGGVFVGTRDGVQFLGGANPASWSARRLDSDVIPFASATVDPSLLDPRLEISDSRAAVWLSRKGYCIGTPTGQVVQPQSNRITIPNASSGYMTIHDRRLLTLVR